jgi:hypothetical protein
MATQNYGTVPGRRPSIIGSAMASPMAQTRRRAQAKAKALPAQAAAQAQARAQRPTPAPVAPVPATPPGGALAQANNMSAEQSRQHAQTNNATAQQQLARKKVTF